MEKARQLIQKGKKGIWRVVFSRTGLITLLLLLQLGFLAALLFFLNEWMLHFWGLTVAFTAFMVLYLLNSRLDSSAKLTWMVLIAVAPVFGSLFYLYARRNWGQRLQRRVLTQRENLTRHCIAQSQPVLSALEQTDPRAASMTRYVGGCGCYPVYRGTDVEYFALGEHMLPRFLEALEQAESFVFLEFFIVEEGRMWNAILDVLTRKARQGVDVRVMYDGTCEFYLLPRSYPQTLEQLGIRCKAFAPVQPFASTHYNFRDHRKIAVIDGKTAFTGGVNLADEYINEKVRFGHWKDTAIVLHGPAVASLTLMFLQLWGEDPFQPDFHRFLTPAAPVPDAAGFVMPYGDSPLDHNRVGEQVYMDLLNRASRYVYIMTPYLILDDQMENTLCYAARRGVDVRIILPGTPDKPSAYCLAKTHFPRLLEAGVKLYTYTPGFIHAKSFVCDDREAVVGTINLDYRSLYHHFECAVWMHGVPAVAQIEADFRDTLTQCEPVTWATVRNEPWHTRLAGFVLKAIAPLL